MGNELLAYCNSFTALNRRYTLPGDCIPNVPTYISIDHEHQNGIINSSLVGVIIGDWKFYNHQGLCFNSKRCIRDKNLIRLFVTCIVLTDWINMAFLFSK
ncbi:hypothetical protein H8356DRAFT_1355466 [Neocallimastix lanati (nom. inval.)]|nr:hypothetical protein H8356DRAFT_1355466 [Neocallimastix sp. JGI-2020a]